MAEPICPDCRDNKHPNCDGVAWDHERDEPTICACGARGHVHEARVDDHGRCTECKYPMFEVDGVWMHDRRSTCEWRGPTPVRALMSTPSKDWVS